MDFAELDRTLRDSVADLALDVEEKFELRELGARLPADRVRYLRNRAFDMARELMLAQPPRTLDSLRWLEQVVKTLDAVAEAPARVSSAFFAPGDACLRKLRELCRSAKRSMDVCVYTISDDRLAEEILACHQRGIAVRVISDNDKRYDDGSDVPRLLESGVPLRIDDSPFHMHHKFALFDGRLLANGSFNWTRSATTSNEENLVVTDDANLVRSFSGHFEALWDKFGN
ncbi:phospholipase D-like domain-containing protein [Lysobacter enzymogenes]|uniref:phospholipase D-like domain-containing protein n=1 Tax=Lysobacter enzymogenes TaxID=69 RepID=UPI00089C3EA3|nr:phospholipase D-like domain-containing protein [Lysobacter enzymogenes]SDX81578.1 PLD-like domain-containing protein [Lysobacter enzymogenes]